MSESVFHQYGRRVVLIAIMLGGALLLQRFLSVGSSPNTEADGSLISPKQREWYDAKMPFWKTLPVVGVEELDALGAGILRLVRSVPPAPLGGTKLFEVEALARDVAHFLWARTSSATAGEYLARATGTRRLRSDNVADDLEIQYWYRTLVGGVPPTRMDAGELIGEFWRLARHPANRIVGVSTEGDVLMARTKPVDPESLRVTLNSVIGSVWPDWIPEIGEHARQWGSPYDRGFPRLTEPSGNSLADVIQKHGTTYFCLMAFVGEAQGGLRVPLSLLLYWSPDEHRWHVLWFTHQHVGGLGRPY